MPRILLAVLLASGLPGCQTITIQPEPGLPVAAAPDFQETKNFFWWGLMGEHRVNVSEICDGREPAQMQSQMTFENGFLTVITLGIYAPHSVKVWCTDPTRQGGVS